MIAIKGFINRLTIQMVNFRFNALSCSIRILRQGDVKCCASFGLSVKMKQDELRPDRQNKPLTQQAGAWIIISLNEDERFIKIM
jgi:hypothetical protein